MLLPSVTLKSDLFVDSSGNDVGITPLGISFFEEGKYPRLLGGRCFIANISTPYIGDFTVEFRGIPQGGGGTGCILATTDYQEGNPGQIAVYVQNTQILIYRSNSVAVEPLVGYTIPTNKRGKVIDVAVVRDGDVFTIYLDGAQVAQSTYATTLTGDGFALFGEVRANKVSVARGFIGIVHHLRLHHGVALPPALFETNLQTQSKSAALSTLTAYVSDPRDLANKFVSRVHVSAKAFIVQYSTGELFAALKERIGPAGTMISNIQTRGPEANQVWVTLTSGAEINAGTQTFFNSEDLPSFPSGFGYLIDDNGTAKYVPINVYGDGKLTEKTYETVLGTLAQTPLSYDENTAIVLEERYSSGQVIQHTGSAGAWVNKPYFITAGPEAEYTVSAAGNVILPVGVYRVIGTHIGQQTRSLSRLYNLTGAVGLVTSTPAVAANNIPAKFFDVGLTVVSPTEITIQSLSETSLNAASMTAKLLNPATVFSSIKIYKVE